MVTRRFWAIAHFGLTLTCLGCCIYLVWQNRELQREREREHQREFARKTTREDFALRKLNQIRWLGGEYELPPGNNHAVIAVLIYKDGQFASRYWSTTWSIDPGESRVIPFQLLWGPTPEGKRALVVQGFSSSHIGNGDELSKFDGPILRVSGSGDDGELRGYRVIGHAASQEGRNGENPITLSFGTTEAVLENRRHVLVLGVKTFANREEARQWRDQPEEAK
jgi:hypothetical protein